KPTITEPHQIEVKVSGDDWRPESRTETIPVVNRRLYFPFWGGLDFDLLKYCNVSTATEGFWTYLARLHGLVALEAVSGPPNSKDDATRDSLEAGWMGVINDPLYDGLDMDEWFTTW